MIRRLLQRNYSVLLKTASLENGVQLSVRHGDITLEEVDAIVNNANSHLINDDGLALNIFKRGGPKIKQDCENILLKFGGPIPTGNVVATSGGDMSCKKVIHAVGPIYSKKGFESQLLLTRTIGNSMRLANLMGMESLSISALCTGLNKFPAKIVSRLLFDEILHFTRHDNQRILKDIRFVDISEVNSKIMAREFENRDFTQGGLRKQIFDDLDDFSGNNLQVIVSDPGEGEPIRNGDMVWVNYVGKLLNGSVFDSSYDR